MSASVPGWVNFQAFTSAGDLADGYQLYTFAAGTTTHKSAFTDVAGTTPHTYTSDGGGGQYIALDARGEIPAPLYLATGAYDLVLKTAAGATVWTRRADGILADLAASTGSSLVGFIQAGTGAVLRTMQAKGRDTVSVKDFGAVGDGVTDDTAAMQLAITAANSKTLIIPAEIFITTGLNFNGWTGDVICQGTIKAKAATTISHIIDFSSASRFSWTGGVIDFNQTSGTLDGDVRSDHGFYMLDARDGLIEGVTFANIRAGEIVYIDGTSSISPSASHGSKRIKVVNCTCVAFDYPTVDVGAAVYIRSDFYTGTNGATCIASSNGCKEADYTLDATVAYQRTTTDIEFANCHFENLDGFRMFNVARVSCSNITLRNSYTRGYSLSPSCEDVSVTGGYVSGNAAHINANFACKRCVFSDLVSQGEETVAGQRHCLRTGFGSTDIKFSNIVGLGCDTRHVFIEGAARVLFSGVNLRNWSGGNTTVAVSIAGGGSGNTSSWVTTDIRFVGCSFQANYMMRVDDYTGTATIADRGVVFDDACAFTTGISAWNGTANYSKVLYTESASFTPTLVGATTSGTQTYTTQVGSYKYHNGLCTWKAHIQLATKDAAMAGNVEVSGIPFPSQAGVGSESAGTVSWYGGVTFPANFTQMGVMHQASRQRATLSRMGSAQTPAYVQASELSGTAMFVLSATYRVA